MSFQKQISAIMRDPSLTAKQRQSRVATLLRSGSSGGGGGGGGGDGGNGDDEGKGNASSSESPPPPTYPNHCPHYARGVDLWCEPCKGYVPCRLCHDEAVDDHAFDRRSKKLKLRWVDACAWCLGSRSGP